MQTLPGPNSGNSTLLEKFLRIAIPAALIYGGIKAYNAWLAPNINLFMHNLPYLIGFCIVSILAVAGILYVISNPMFIWMQYKNLCRYITSFFIKLDPLSFMDRYIDLLTKKRQGLQERKRTLSAQAIALKREIDNLAGSINDNMKKADAAQQTGKNNIAVQFSTYAANDKKSRDLYIPIYTKIQSVLKFLEELDENWGISIDSLTHEVARKRKEYTTLKVAAEALGQAEEFAKGDTEAARIYKESVAALEQNVSEKIAFIDDFEKASKSVMDGIDIDKKVMNNEGMNLLEEYQRNGKLLLPTDNWIEAKVVSSSPITMNSSTSNSETDSLIDLPK